jgi:hypothetical protein
VLALSLLMLTLPAAPAAEATAASGNDLDGRWAVLQVLSNRSDVPFVGDAVANTRLVLLFDLQQRDTRLVGDGEVCHLDIKARPELVRPVIPESYRKTVRQQRFEAAIEREGAVTRLRAARQRGLLGARLDRPWQDPLPERGSPRIVDSDGDGKPGMTMHIEGLFDIEFYMAQRQWTQMVGTRKSRDRFAGQLHHRSEQVFLGADHFIMQFLPAMEPDPRESRFEMVRLRPDASCQQAVARMLPSEVKASKTEAKATRSRRAPARRAPVAVQPARTSKRADR